MKQSYTGGAVDVYKPGILKENNILKENITISKETNIISYSPKKIYRYDVNSLYPYVMREFPMPVGNATYFEGGASPRDMRDNKPFGFFEVDIKTPYSSN